MFYFDIVSSEDETDVWMSAGDECYNVEFIADEGFNGLSLYRLWYETLENAEYAGMTHSMDLSQDIKEQK